MKALSIKEVVYVIGFLFGMGVTWGVFTTKLNAQGESIKELKPTNERLAVLETKTGLILESLGRLEKRLPR